MTKPQVTKQFQVKEDEPKEQGQNKSDLCRERKMPGDARIPTLGRTGWALLWWMFGWRTDRAEECSDEESQSKRWTQLSQLRQAGIWNAVSQTVMSLIIHTRLWDCLECHWELLWHGWFDGEYGSKRRLWDLRRTLCSQSRLQIVVQKMSWFNQTETCCWSSFICVNPINWNNLVSFLCTKSWIFRLLWGLNLWICVSCLVH